MERWMCDILDEDSKHLTPITRAGVNGKRFVEPHALCIQSEEP
jgi:hypothetical protein